MALKKNSYLLIWPSVILALGALTRERLTAANPESGFAVQQRWKIGGPGGWDHLTTDPTYHRLYVTRSDRVTVLDTETGRPHGEILGLQNAHYVCLDSKGKYGYITDGASHTVLVFDRVSLRAVTSLPTGRNPNMAVFDSLSQAVFVFNDSGRSATVIDASLNAVAGTIEIPGKPAGTVADQRGSVFVNLQDSGRIVRIDTRTRAIVSNWSIEGCVGPNGLAMDTGRGRIYAVCENNELVMIDGSTGKLLANTKLSEGARDVVFDSHRDLIFAVNAGGTVSVVKGDSSGHLVTLETLKTQAGARTLALDATTERIYLPTAQFGLRTGETSEELLFRPTPVPGSFSVLVVGD